MSDKINSLFAEKYRPQSLDDFVGNQVLIDRFRSYEQEKDIPHLLLVGGPGVGKTTLAKLIVKRMGVDWLYINASDENNIETVRYKIKSFAMAVSFSDNIKVVILDEADYMTPNAQAALRNLMETTSKYTRFILTANYSNRISSPILSRCTLFEVLPLSKPNVAARLDQILKLEKVEYDIADVVPIINAHFPDLRKVLNELQKAIKDTKLVVDERQIIESDYRLKILDMLKDSKLKRNDKFVKIRKLILDNQVKEFTDLYTLLYENINEIVPGKDEYTEQKADAILVLADQQYQDAFVVDKEITFSACIVRLLGLMD